MKRSTIWGMAFGAWFGGSLAMVAGLNITDGGFWIIFGPAVLLSTLEKRAYRNENQKP